MIKKHIQSSFPGPLVGSIKSGRMGSKGRGRGRRYFGFFQPNVGSHSAYISAGLSSGPQHPEGVSESSKIE